MSQVFALAKRHLRYPTCLVDRLLPEFVAKAVLVDGDQAEAARREGIAENGVHACCHSRRPSGDLAQDEIARFGILQVADREFAPLLLLYRCQPEAFTL